MSRSERRFTPRFEALEALSRPSRRQTWRRILTGTRVSNLATSSCVVSRSRANGLWRICREIHICRCHFFVLQVVENRHPAAMLQGWIAERYDLAVTGLVHELAQRFRLHHRLQRGDGPMQSRRVAEVWPHRV